jgi:hypothetical protein
MMNSRWWQVEWQVVSQAPLSFGISLFTLSLLIGGVQYGLYHSNLELKTDRVASLREENDRLRNEIRRLVKLNALEESPLKEPPDTNKECPDACESPAQTQRM